MVGPSPHSPQSPGHPNSPGRRFANSVRSGVNFIEHQTGPEQAGQKNDQILPPASQAGGRSDRSRFDRQTARYFAQPRCQPRRYRKLESACQSFL